MKRYDFLIIGAGPGGISAALTAAKRRQHVALIEHKMIGGTCLHEGCLPSKSLLASAKYLQSLRHGEDYGVTFEPPKGSLVDFFNRQKSVVSKIYQHTLKELTEAGVHVIHGQANLISPGKVQVQTAQNIEILEARKTIIATGSVPVCDPLIPFDGKNILNSSQALHLLKLPASVGLIGGGYIPCSHATLFSTLGSKVTLIEKGPSLLPQFDHVAGHFLERSFVREGITVLTKTCVVSATTTDSGVQVHLAEGDSLFFEKVLYAGGRQPNLHGLEALAQGGSIPVNSFLETAWPGTYAVGDVNNLSTFASSAVMQGRTAALHALGYNTAYKVQAAPRCAFTHPEIASIGLSESQAREQGYEILTAQKSFSIAGKAIAMGEMDGLVKLIIERKTTAFLGGTIICSHASEIIGQLGMALTLNAKLSDLTNITTAHPTFSETIQEVAWELELGLMEKSFT